jgi:hypothetical protein
VLEIFSLVAACAQPGLLKGFFPGLGDVHWEHQTPIVAVDHEPSRAAAASLASSASRLALCRSIAASQ